MPKPRASASRLAEMKPQTKEPSYTKTVKFADGRVVVFRRRKRAPKEG